MEALEEILVREDLQATYSPDGRGDWWVCSVWPITSGGYQGPPVRGETLERALERWRKEHP